MSIWAEFDRHVDLEGLKSDIANSSAGNSDYKEVEHGTYEVSIEKMELKKSKSGNPMLSIWFKILEGPFKNQLIFYNQVVSNGFGIHMANEFLRSLKLGDVEFESYGQYAELIERFNEAAPGNEYALEYGKNAKGFNTYKITNVFVY